MSELDDLRNAVNVMRQEVKALQDRVAEYEGKGLNDFLNTRGVARLRIGDAEVLGTLYFGDGQTDYLANNLIHFEAETAEKTTIEFTPSAANSFLTYFTSKYASATDAQARWYVFKDGDPTSIAELKLVADDGSPEIYSVTMNAGIDSAAGGASIVALTDSNYKGAIQLTATDFIQANGIFVLDNYALMQIASGVLATKLSGASYSYLNVAAETSTTDNLDTLTIDSDVPKGAVFVLQAYSGHTITIRHNTGSSPKFLNHGSVNIAINNNDTVMYIYNGTDMVQMAPATAVP